MHGAPVGGGDERVAYRPLHSEVDVRALERALWEELHALEAREAELTTLLSDPRLEKRLRRAPSRADPLPVPPQVTTSDGLRTPHTDQARYAVLVGELAQITLPANASDLAWLHGRLTGTGRAAFRNGAAELRGATRTLVAPDAAEVPTHVDRVLDWATKETAHPAILALVLAGEVLAIRPFKQADRLLSRLLLRHVLQQNGMGSIGHVVLDRRVDLGAPESVDRLIEAIAGDAADPWLTDTLAVLRSGLEVTLADARLAGRYLDRLNERQWRVAEWFRHNHDHAPQGSWRFREIHAAFPSVPPRTLKRDLATLREVEIIRMDGKLKSARYHYLPEPAGTASRDSLE